VLPTLQQDASDPPTAKPDCNTLRFQLNTTIEAPPVAYSLIFRRVQWGCGMDCIFAQPRGPRQRPGLINDLSQALALRFLAQLAGGLLHPRRFVATAATRAWWAEI